MMMKFLEKIKTYAEKLMENKNISIVILVVALLGGTLFFVTNSFSNSVSIGSDEQYYQVFLESKIDVSGGTLTQTEDETLIYKTNIDGKSEVIPLEETPLYYKDDNSFLVTADMVYVDYNTTKQERIAKLSVISFDEEGINITYQNETNSLSKAFLFDGNDTYVFLENVEVKIDGEVYELSTFSFIKKYSTTQLVVYDYATGKSELVDYSTAQINHVSYTLDLVSNKLKYSNGAFTLLFAKPELLDLV